MILRAIPANALKGRALSIAVAAPSHIYPVRLSWPSPPDLFEYKFVNSRLVNSTFLHNKEGCPLDVTGTGEGAYMVYFVSFLGTLAVLPGNIVSALLMDKIGRLRMLGKAGRLAGGASKLFRGLGEGEGCHWASQLSLWKA